MRRGGEKTKTFLKEVRGRKGGCVGELTITKMAEEGGEIEAEAVMWWGGVRKCREYIRGKWWPVSEVGESCQNEDCVCGGGWSARGCHGESGVYRLGDIRFFLFILISKIYNVGLAAPGPASSVVSG